MLTTQDAETLKEVFRLWEATQAGFLAATSAKEEARLEVNRLLRELHIDPSGFTFYSGGAVYRWTGNGLTKEAVISL
jgi:hypothetical protein